MRLHPTPTIGIVVERSPVRSFAADYPICIIVIHSHLTMFQIYVVVNTALRNFQQLDGLFFNRITAKAT